MLTVVESVGLSLSLSLSRTHKHNTHLTMMLHETKVSPATATKSVAPKRMPVFCTAQGRASMPAPTAVVTRLAICTVGKAWQRSVKRPEAVAAAAAAVAATAAVAAARLHCQKAHPSSQPAFARLVARYHGLLLRQQVLKGAAIAGRQWRAWRLLHLSICLLYTVGYALR